MQELYIVRVAVEIPRFDMNNMNIKTSYIQNKFSKNR